MPAQCFQACEPIDGTPSCLYLESLEDDCNGVRLLLRGDETAGPMLRLLFESPVGFRNINESYRWGTLSAREGGWDLPTLLTVENSAWIRWLVEEARGVLRAEALTHYGIYTPEDWVDVVTEFPPDVEWVA